MCLNLTECSKCGGSTYLSESATMGENTFELSYWRKSKMYFGVGLFKVLKVNNKILESILILHKEPLQRQ